jgi:hypothetical protein
MAAAVKYFDTAKIAHGRATTGVTATDGSGTGSTFTWYNTAPSGDWMLTKIIFSSTSATGVGNPADSLLHIFVDDATTSRIIRTIDLGDPAVGSTTVSGWQLEVNFGPEFIFPSTVLPEFTISVTPTAGNIDAVLFAQAA